MRCTQKKRVIAAVHQKVADYPDEYSDFSATSSELLLMSACWLADVPTVDAKDQTEENQMTDPQGTAVVARQPICDRAQNTFAYELLYRNPGETTAVIDNQERATAEVIVNSFMEIGLERMGGRATAFINVTRDFILGNHCRSLPAGRVVFEILENTEPDSQLLDAVAALTRDGYVFALDDYTFEDRMKPFLPFCRYIKVDARQTPPALLGQHIEGLRQFPVKLLAEKVETPEEFAFYKEHGFEYFQGYFYCRPKLFSTPKISRNRLAVSQLLTKLHQADVSTRDIEKIVCEDISLSYQLLRYINSAAFSLPRQIESIAHAVRLVGTDHIRRLASLMMLAGVDDKPRELLTTSLVRAKMCELLAQRHNYANTEAHFTVGMLSTLDAFLDCPLPEALTQLPLSSEMRDALMHYEGKLGSVLQRVLTYETGNWAALDELRADTAPMARAYWRALEFGEGVIQQMGAWSRKTGPSNPTVTLA
jgi:EAL and modified HD-GYP domain-containing signal transduction protein